MISASAKPIWLKLPMPPETAWPYWARIALYSAIFGVVVPLRAERLGEEVGVAGGRAAPQLDVVLQAEFLRRLQDHQRLWRGEVEDHRSVRPGVVDLLDRYRV